MSNNLQCPFCFHPWDEDIVRSVDENSHFKCDNCKVLSRNSKIDGIISWAKTSEDWRILVYLDAGVLGFLPNGTQTLEQDVIQIPFIQGLDIQEIYTRLLKLRTFL